MYCIQREWLNPQMKRQNDTRKFFSLKCVKNLVGHMACATNRYNSQVVQTAQPDFTRIHKKSQLHTGYKEKMVDSITALIS